MARLQRVAIHIIKDLVTILGRMVHLSLNDYVECLSEQARTFGSSVETRATDYRNSCRGQSIKRGQAVPGWSWYILSEHRKYHKTLSCHPDYHPRSISAPAGTRSISRTPAPSRAPHKPKGSSFWLVADIGAKLRPRSLKPRASYFFTRDVLALANLTPVRPCQTGLPNRSSGGLHDLLRKPQAPS